MQGGLLYQKCIVKTACAVSNVLKHVVRTCFWPPHYVKSYMTSATCAHVNVNAVLDARVS